jgi:inosose dehydratase
VSTDSAPATGDPIGQAPVGVVPLLWDLTREPALGVLEEIARLGLRGVQWHETFSDLPAAFGLAVAEVYAAVPCDVDGPAPDAADTVRRRLARLQELGGDVLVVACDGSEDRDRIAGRATAAATPRLTTAGWRRLAALVTGVAEDARSLGHRVAFHAHAGTHVETADELATLMAMTDPDLVGVCLDTGHHIVGGDDPVSAVATYGERITHVHLKDVAAPVLTELTSGRLRGLRHAIDQRIFCPLNHGLLDLPAMISALRRAGYRGWLMLEQDSSWEPPATAVTASRDALTSVLASAPPPPNW